jgi:hypothetical protein
MQNEFHPRDEEILSFLDGELLAPRSAEVQAHLAACWNCRVRLAELEQTITEFTRGYHESLNPQLPAVAGSRALLKARLVEMAPASKAGLWDRLLQYGGAPRVAYAGLAAAMTVLALAQFLTRRTGNAQPPAAYSLAAVIDPAAIPDRRLTPGATRKVSVADVCRDRHEEVVRVLPEAVQQKIYREYGIANPRASEYEIDFLIAPGLGGTDDVHNLWPQPNKTVLWNAHVKDELEEQLHQMVCNGQLDLSTAQQDIANDWVVAYQKYFHTDKPLPPVLTRLLVGKDRDT